MFHEVSHALVLKFSIKNTNLIIINIKSSVSGETQPIDIAVEENLINIIKRSIYEISGIIATSIISNVSSIFNYGVKDVEGNDIES